MGKMPRAPERNALTTSSRSQVSDQQDLGNLGMGKMKPAQCRHGFGNVGVRVQRQKRDARMFHVDRLEDGGSIHGAGGDVELGVATQGAREQLGLHTIGVGNEDTNRRRSGGGRRTHQVLLPKYSRKTMWRLQGGEVRSTRELVTKSERRFQNGNFGLLSGGNVGKPDSAVET